MGCVVNGPGEASAADIGIAGGKGCGVLFKKGEIIKKVKEEELFDALVYEIEKMQGRQQYVTYKCKAFRFVQRC